MELAHLIAISLAVMIPSFPDTLIHNARRIVAALLELQRYAQDLKTLHRCQVE